MADHHHVMKNALCDKGDVGRWSGGEEKGWNIRMDVMLNVDVWAEVKVL